MAKDERYGTVRPMFTRQKLKTFGDIFKLVPKSVVAADLGKEKGRFNELVENPDDFILQEIIKLSGNCNLTLPEMAVLLKPECQKNKKDNDQKKVYEYEIVRPMFEEQKINLFEDIFKYIPKSTVAINIGKKRERFYQAMTHVENFFVRDIVEIGRLCDLTIPEMFKLVEAQYAKQNNRKS